MCDDRNMIRFERDAELERWPAIPADELAAGSPVQRGLTLLDEPSFGLSAGIWDCTAHTSAWMDQPTHEFMILLEGEVTIVTATRETTFRAGDAFVLPQGLHCQWQQLGYVKKFWVTFEGTSDQAVAGGLRAILVDPTAPLSASAPPPPEVLLSGSPVQHAHESFVDPTGQFSVGIWDTTAYHRRLVPFDRWELMHILQGEAALADEQGRAEIVTVGDTFMEPLGALTTWQGEGYLKKIYCLFRSTT